MTRWIVAALAVVALYLAGVPRNPPGFFIDEASIAYNALSIAERGVDEHGERFPLFFKAFGEYKNPVYVYALAAVFLVTGPGILAARVLSALFGIAAVLVLGRLAWVQTRSQAATLLTIGLAALSPGLFELSRLVFEVAAFPLALALFLLAARAAFDGRGRVIPLAAALVLVTYTYTAGRILGPVLAVLLLVIWRRRALLLVWLLYGLALVPLFVVNARSDGALLSREGVTVEDKSSILKNYVANASPAGLVLRGDPNARHHMPGAGGPVLLATFLLALAAIVLGIRDRWVQFLAAAALASILPAAVAVDAGHALRLSGLFVFLVALAIPVLPRLNRLAAAAVVVTAVLQAGLFFFVFHSRGAARRDEFNADVASLVFASLDQPQRPVYLDAGPGAVFAYWYGALRGEGRNAFVLLKTGERPPGGAVYIGGAEPRPDSVVVRRFGAFGMHRILSE